MHWIFPELFFSLFLREFSTLYSYVNDYRCKTLLEKLKRYSTDLLRRRLLLHFQTKSLSESNGWRIVTRTYVLPKMVAIPPEWTENNRSTLLLSKNKKMFGGIYWARWAQNIINLDFELDIIGRRKSTSDVGFEHVNLVTVRLYRIIILKLLLIKFGQKPFAKRV